MQEATGIASSASRPRITQARSARWFAMLALCSPWFTAGAGTPPANPACAAGQVECASGAKPEVAVDADEWKNAGDPRGLMVVIQSNLDRVSAGQPVWPAPKGVVPDARLQIVDAYADFLRGDFEGMDASIAKAEQASIVLRWRWRTPAPHYPDWRIGNTEYYKQFAVSNHKWMTLVQSGLIRVQEGRPLWPTAQGTAPIHHLSIPESIYVNRLIGFFRDMDTTVQAIRFPRPPTPKREQYAYDWTARNPGFHKIFAAAAHDPSPLVRLYAALRDVDGSLFSALGNPFDRTGPQMYVTPSSLDGTWVRLPCRTVVGRVPQFVAATDTLESLGGPVLDCPVDGTVDYAKDEMLALHPGQLNAHVTPPPVSKQPFVAPSTPAPPPPDSRDTALSEMGTHPQQAASILEHYSHVDAQGELDYALFLHSFEPQTPARDATIRTLQGDLYKKAMASPGKVDDFPLMPYDGSDDSLLNIIRLASEAGITNSADYDIPCSFLIARPALVAATGEYYGSNRDNFMPRPGCTDHDYERMGFPNAAVAAFEAASTQADGNFIDTFQGTMVYGFEAQQNSVNTSMRIAPRDLMQPSPDRLQSFDYPYQVWGYTSLNNYVVSQRLRKLYLVAHDRLAAYYRKHMQLDRADSEQAAKAALFRATFGGDCGGNVPATSLRRMLLEHASLHDIAQQLDGNDHTDAPEISACAQYAGVDPLLLVAVANPAAFPQVLQREPDINKRNAIGKTALMEAAQFDKAGIANLLLQHHAAVNATTWGNQDGFSQPLGDDARTALMYAAANGSLDLIKALLDAGADPHQADTKGHRAIDYLLGYGPTPPNPRLDAQQREQVAQWLF